MSFFTGKSGWGKGSLMAAFLVFAALPGGRALAEEYAVHGRASWYGTTAHGKPTASGEIFDRRSFTAAHKTLPFGTVLRVFNLKNRRYTLVQVADRGPFVKGRIVDVSRRAAEQLRMRRAGVASVSIEVVGNARGEALDRDNSFYLYMSDAQTRDRAESVAAGLQKTMKQPARVLFSLREAHPSYAICLGPFKTFKQAELTLVTIEKDGPRTRGIIEAPTKGGDIPRHVPPTAQGKRAPPKKR